MRQVYVVKFVHYWIQYNVLYGIPFQNHTYSEWLFAFWFQANEIQFDFNIGAQHDGANTEREEKVTRKEKWLCGSECTVVSLTCNQFVKYPAVRHILCDFIISQRSTFTEFTASIKWYGTWKKSFFFQLSKRIRIRRSVCIGPQSSNRF